MTEQDKSPFATIDEVAKHFSVSVSTIRSWVAQGKITEDTYIKVGVTYRFRIPMIEAALSSKPSQTA